MMLDVSALPSVPIVAAGYALMIMSVVGGIAVLAWEGRNIGHPATLRQSRQRAYVESLVGAVARLSSAVLVAVTASVSVIALAWAMS